MSDRLSPAQIRAARAMLDWSMADLAAAACVSVSTVKRVESGGLQSASGDTCGLVRGALEMAGIQFLPDEGCGLGMRLRPR